MSENKYNSKWVLYPSNAGQIVKTGNGAEIQWNQDFYGGASLKVALENQIGKSRFSDSLLIHVKEETYVSDVNSKGINIFPNPCNGKTTISLDDEHYFGTVHIYDGSGRLYKEIELDDLETRLEIENSGIYLLKFFSGNRERSQIIIVN